MTHTSDIKLVRTPLFLPATFLGSLVAGICGAFALPPVGLAFALPISISGLYILLSMTKRPVHSALMAWLFGFGYFVTSLSWIANALLVEGNSFSWAWPLAICGLPALLACFPALCLWISVRLYDIKTLSGFIVFCLSLSIAEWLRGFLFTGFPWNVYAYIWFETLPILQILHFIGLYSLTCLTVFWCAIPGYALVHRNRSAILILTFGIVSFLSVYTFGYMRLQAAPMQNLEGPHVKIIQPNIAQHEKWAPDKRLEHFANLLQLSQASADEKQDTLIIWPETAISFRLLDRQYYKDSIKDVLNGYSPNTTLLTGALLLNREYRSLSNSLITIPADDTPEQRYDKHHLVPFGEYIPFKSWIPLPTVTKLEGFRPGHGLDTLPVLNNKLTFSPLICYEIVFPNQVIGRAMQPDVIINLTNDGWYGDSWGPYQHFAKAQFRAIEEGVPVIRSANTGISGIIDPYGRIVARIDLESRGTINGKVPKRIPLNSPASVVRIFSFPALVIVGLIYFALMTSFSRFRYTKGLF